MAKTKGRINGGDEPGDEIVRGNVNRQVERSPSFVSVYANDVQLQTTPWDVRLTFGAMSVEVRSGTGPTAHVSELSEVRLSPQLAKRVAAILVAQVEAYELKFGTIPQPSEG
jgi:hypothetical protein